MSDLVQARNPKTDRYTLIDRACGKILKQKRTAGPYKNIPIAVKRTPDEGGGMTPTAMSWAEFERRAKATVLEVLAAFRDEGDEMLAGIIADNVASLVDDIWGLEADKGVMPLTETITPGYQSPSR